MKAICQIIALIGCWNLLIAAEPTAAKTDYSSLKIEEIAMRFRFPARYVDANNGEVDPRGMALAEMFRRKLLKTSIRMAEVDFLLGPESAEIKHGQSPYYQSYAMQGWNLIIVFEEKVPRNEKLLVADIFEERGGELRRLVQAHVLKTEQDGAGQPATVLESTPQGDRKPNQESEGRPQ